MNVDITSYDRVVTERDSALAEVEKLRSRVSELEKALADQTIDVVPMTHEEIIEETLNRR